MNDVAELLDRAVPEYAGSGRWTDVLRDAGVRPAARRRRTPVRIAAAVALAAAAALLAVTWPFGGEPPSVIDKALAATGNGQVLHVVFEGDIPRTLVNLETGERREERGTHEVWFDPTGGLRETEVFDGVVQFDTTLGAAAIPEHAREVYTSLGAGYRKALESGQARVVGEDTVDGEPVYWIRITSDEGPAGELAHDVAVSQETYAPVSFRLMGGTVPAGSTGVTRILTYETIGKDEAPFGSPSPRLSDPGSVDRDGGPVDLADAASVLGGTPVWAGPELNGLELTSTRKLDLPTANGTVHGISLVYGTLSEDGSAGGGGHVEIKQAARPAAGLTMLVGLHDYVPDEGMLVIQGVSGLLRSNGMVVAIHSGDPEAIVAVAKALRPYDGR
jgi:hypothetical protein